jgi:glycosyltransferase involved in cell wall biosynthesis
LLGYPRDESMNSCPVSVVIPTFNRASLLGRALDSIIRQTLPPDEIIIVNDGSTDETVEKIHSFMAQSPVETQLISTTNKGPAAARNTGILASKNEFIAFLDSDDHWLKNKIKLQYNALKDKEEFFISHTKERWLRRGKHLNQKKIHIPKHGDIFAHCLRLCAVGMSTVMVRKTLFKVVGVFDETMMCCEDYDLWLRVSCKYPFLLIDTPLAIKEGGREDQVSYQYRLGMDDLRIKSIHKMLSTEILDRKYFIAATEEIIRKLMIFGNGCLKHDKIEQGEQCFKMIDQCKRAAVERYPDWKSDNG